MRCHARASAAGSIFGKARPAALLAIAALFTLAFCAQALAADRTYLSSGTFSSEGIGDGQLTHPRRIAVEGSTGNVLVVDRDNDRVQVFSPTAEAATFLTKFGEGVLDEPFGIAIDQSNGDVYVSDAGNEEIVKFESDGAVTPTYTVVPGASFVSPAKGEGAGEIKDFAADIAVDAGSGDLLVADPGNNRVDRYEADGTFDAAGSFDGADSPDGSFKGLLDLDVAPNGDVYAVDSNGPVFVEGGEVGAEGLCFGNAYCDSNPTRVLRFDSAGEYRSTVPAPRYPNSDSRSVGLVAVDPDSSQVVVGDINPQGSGFKVTVYAPGGQRQVDAFAVAPEGWMPALAIGGGEGSRLYVARDREPHSGGGSFGEVLIRAFASVTLPEVTIDPVEGTIGSTAQVSGTVNPQGSAATWLFQVSEAGGGFVDGPSGSVAAGTSFVPVAAELTGLEPATSYQVRLLVKNAGEKYIPSDPVGFSTSVAAPYAISKGAAPRTETTARMNGYLNPRNSATAYFFEFGPTSAYGTNLPASEDAVGGSENGLLAVSQMLIGLQPGTTYHYRLVAENAGGRTEGADQTFTTRNAAEAGPQKRGIELVNNPDKGNQIALTPEGIKATADASQIFWNTLGGAPGGTTGNGSVFMAQRTPEGWRSRSMLPPASQLVGGGDATYTPLIANPGFDRFIYKVSSGVEAAVPKTIVSMGLDFSQQVLGVVPPKNDGTFNDAFEARANDDFSHLYLNVKFPGQAEQLYDFAADPPELVSVMPDDDPAPCGVIRDGTSQWAATSSRWLATSPGAPARVFFETSGNPTCVGKATNSEVYMRDLDSETTTLLSGPALPGGPQDETGTFAATSHDGSTAIFIASSRLTPEDDNDGGDLYRYTVGVGPECLTCIGPGADLVVSLVERHVVVSDDLSRIYFSSENVLAPGGQAGTYNLYVWRDGQIHFVAPLSAGAANSIRQNTTVLSDGGRVLFFRDGHPQATSDNTGGFTQYYRYGERDNTLECVTCSPGHTPTAGPREPLLAARAQGGISTVAENGDAIVFATIDAIDRRDINGDADIYEWRNGQLGLVTDGVTQYPRGGSGVSGELSLIGIGNDGLNVLFGAGAHLTGYERDNTAQIFVARVGGGFPPPPSEAASCGEETCQGPLQPAAAWGTPASAAFDGSGNQRGGAAPRKRCPKASRKRARVGRCAKKRTQKKKAQKRATSNRATSNKRGGGR